MPGIMPTRLPSGPIFLTCCICSRKSSRVNCPSSSLAAAASACVLLVDLLGLLDEREDVAHAEDAAGQAVGVEQVEVGELLAGRREGDRPADDLLHRQGGAAAGVAVELGEDDAVEGERLVERLGGGDRVLAGHGVDDEERVVRLDGARRCAGPASIISASMARRPAVSTMTTSRPEAAGLGDALGRAVSTGSPGFAEHRHVDLAAERAQLLDGGGALEVGADQQRVAALLLEPAGQLGRVGGLARALQAGHQHDGGRLRGEGDPDRLAAEGGDELLVDDLDDLLGRVERLATARRRGPLADARARSRGRP